jgi:aminopeptidase C
MIYVLKKEGEKQIEISFPKFIDDNWVVEQVDFEFRETTTYSFDSEEQANFFLETHIDSFRQDGFQISFISTLTED